MDWMLLPYRRYTEFSGRSRRMEYWMFALLMFLVYSVGIGIMFAGGFSMAALAGQDPEAFAPGPLFFLGGGLLALFAIASFLPSIAVVVRRLHDRNLSGWWYLGVILASMIPFVGFIASIAFLVVMCLEGTRGPNRFGPDPKDPASVDVFA